MGFTSGVSGRETRHWSLRGVARSAVRGDCADVRSLRLHASHGRQSVDVAEEGGGEAEHEQGEDGELQKSLGLRVERHSTKVSLQGAEKRERELENVSFSPSLFLFTSVPFSVAKTRQVPQRLSWPSRTSSQCSWKRLRFRGECPRTINFDSKARRCSLFMKSFRLRQTLPQHRF